MDTAARAADSVLRRRFLWVSLLTLATVGGSLALACAMPFAGLAALAALFLRRRDAFVLIGVNWLANQAIGFGLLNYPWTWATLQAGVLMGLAALGCTGAAMLAWNSLRKIAFPAAVVGVFAATFVVYECLNYVFSIGHNDGDYSLSILLYLLYLNGLAFAGLLILQRVAEAIGVAAPRGTGQPADARIPAAS